MNTETSITLRKGTESDTDLFFDIEKTIQNHVLYSPTIDQNEAQNEIKQNVFYFISIKNNVVGYIEYEIKNPQDVYISGLVIKPDFQGKGIARKSLNMVLSELMSFKKIWLVTHPDNIKAISLYKSLGFKLGERKENYFGDGEPRISLSLER